MGGHKQRALTGEQQSMPLRLGMAALMVRSPAIQQAERLSA
ncbi:hypothetical protein SFOMI_0714 [Sphingobium fuliginis]|uniref:Uncharacterized protein n=1 Tax=Sphingobium fuliginis (strain ATCC 27551) TaxID=336203 RepID=A0A292ZBC0_SPHSA|nr:hypothetical protein SFOMI_0714 [Sphingobium fuliginis]